MFDGYKPLYFRADLLRVIAARETVATQAPGTCFVYADFTIEALAPGALMTEETVSQLNTYGIVMAKPARPIIAFENSFQITTNTNPNMLAMDAVLIRKSLSAPSQVRVYVRESDLPYYTYLLFPQVFEVFHAIDGRARFVLGEELLTMDKLSRVDEWVSVMGHDFSRIGKFFPGAHIKPPEGKKYIELVASGFHESKLLIPTKEVGAVHSNHAF